MVALRGAPMIRASLRRLELLSEFRDWELDRLRALMSELRVPAGTAFVTQGAATDSDDARAFLVVAGEVRVTRVRPDGSPIFDVLLGPGAFIGVVALLLDHERAATCTAETDARLLAIDRRTFASMYDADSKLAVRFKLVVARQLAQDLRRANQAVAARARTTGGVA